MTSRDAEYCSISNWQRYMTGFLVGVMLVLAAWCWSDESKQCEQQVEACKKVVSR